MLINCTTQESVLSAGFYSPSGVFLWSTAVQKKLFFSVPALFQPSDNPLSPCRWSTTLYQTTISWENRNRLPRLSVHLWADIETQSVYSNGGAGCTASCVQSWRLKQMMQSELKKKTEGDLYLNWPTFSTACDYSHFMHLCIRQRS